ncbi:hypothetical protein M2R47_08755 [Moraxella sp. Tifton1]|uniref:hypothetical protein n=1 Tax=Moraxella oculi TaxID=2940516 RepID=UPI0020118D4A|nr:hypothetical protein [Moraxella sp. Tifton1]MCL1624321.1 hypothetical protein [Moraxella sp. Tifton1]
MSNIYQLPQEIDFNELKKYIDTNDNKKAIEGIIGASLYCKDREGLHYFIGDVLRNCQNNLIKNACIKACSHMVRIDGYINDDIISYINNLNGEGLYDGAISDFQDDIEIYLK